MEIIKQVRERYGLSQRKFAARVGISFRTLQLLESGNGNPRLSTLGKICQALGCPSNGVAQTITRYLQRADDSIASISIRIVADDPESWKLWLFNFVDAFRKKPDNEMVSAPPIPETPVELRCLMASTVETLCEELTVAVPWWCAGAGILPAPWFVAGIENLKALALVESPVHFRKRNIFVLGNFLSRV